MAGYIDLERIDRVRTAIQQAELAGLLCTMPENILMLTGYWSRVGMSLVWFPADGDPTLLVPEPELSVAELGWANEIHPYVGELDANKARAEMSAFIADKLHNVKGKVGYEASFGQIAPPPLAGEPHVVDKVFVDMLASCIGLDRLFDATALLYELRSRKTPHEVELIRRANQIASEGLNAFK